MEALPFSHITDRIAIPCVRCDEYVEVRTLQQHREMHRVWKILQCTSNTAPKTIKQLLRKRRQIINSAMKKLEPGVPLPAIVLQKIDWAFEVVRHTLFESDRPFVSDSSTVNNLAPLSYLESPIKNTSLQRKVIDHTVNGISEKLRHCAQSVGVCQHSNIKWRTTNEDRFFCTESSLGDLEFCLFGLFDGHNGQAAAEKCSEKFYGFIREELVLCTEKTDTEILSEDQLRNREDLVKQAIRNSFFKMDSYLLSGESEPSKVRWSGTSATVCYIENDTLYAANSGRVRALFVKKDGSAVSLLQDHTLKNKNERDRIRKATGARPCNTRTTFGNSLFSSTRGLGNHGDPTLKSVMITEPSISVFKIDPSDQFLVLFTAGISDIFNDEEVMFLLEDIMPDTSEIESLREHFLLKDQIEEEQQGLNQTDQSINCSGGMESINTSQKMAGLQFERNKSNESKPCFLARALVERLVYSAVLAGTRENTSAMVVLLHGCPINLYLLPNVKRKSLFLRDLKMSESDIKLENKVEITLDKYCNE